jgi:hypothetical protein
VATVYHFKVWDPQRGENVIQPLKSTAERIKTIGGEIILGTAEEVPFSALDTEGRYSSHRQGVDLYAQGIKEPETSG